MARSRLEEVDILRSVACISVVVTHVSATILSLGISPPAAYWFLLFLNRFCLTNVPLFVFLSGVVLYYNYAGRPLPIFEFWKKRVTSTYFPFVFWSVLFYAIYVKAGLYALDLNVFLLAILRGTATYHLYFVIIIMQFYLLFPLLKVLFDKCPFWVMLLLGITLNLLGFAFSNYGWKIGLPAYWLDRHALSYILFFFLGCLWAKYRHTHTSFKLPSILLFGLLLGQNVAKVGVMSLLYANPSHPWNAQYQLLWLGFSVADMLLFSAAALRWGKALPPLIHSSMAFVGNHSYTIYLSHPLFLLAGQWVAKRFAWQEPWSLFFGLFLFTLAGSLVLAEVMKQIALRLPAWKADTPSNRT